MRSDIFRPTLFVTSLTLLAACGAGDGGEEVAEREARIALAPAAPGMLPAAITGDAPPPGGIDVHYLPGDSATTGYLAVPDGAGPFPSVLLVHEWNGLVDRIRQMADAFAAEGYVALAADLFGGRTGGSPEENRALTSEARADMPGVIANLNAAAAFLRARPDVTGRVAVMGWCFGGGIALSYGLDGDNHEGTAIFYGSLIEDPERLQALTHEVYGTFAQMDNGIPPDQVERFVEALRSIGVENDVHVYDDVNHGFWLRVDEDPDVRRDPALDAWERLKAYLDRTLGG